MSRKLDGLTFREPLLEPWHSILLAILMLETRERPRFARALEWLLYLMRLNRDLTCGVFQMKSAPYRFEVAAREVALRLSSQGCEPSLQKDSLDKIARVWNGAASRQPGSCIGYADALRCALRISQVIEETYSAPGPAQSPKRLQWVRVQLAGISKSCGNSIDR